MNIFKRIILYFKLKIRYTKYFDKLNIDKFVFISDIDDEITSIYRVIKDYPVKYKKYISLYDDKKKEIIEHNRIVDNLKQFVDNFDFNLILDNPYKFDFDKFDFEIKLLKEHNFDNDKIRKILLYYDNFEEIRMQYTLFEKLKEIILFEDKYLDREDKYLIINKVNTVKQELSQFNDNYYDFNFIDNLQEKIDEHNDEFVISNLENGIFNDVNGKSLDNEQRAAILRDDVANLVVAGAGSGKTLTICGKVKYLIETKNIDPSEILLISYSKKSADDLDTKAKSINPLLHASTFHKLGLDILKQATKIKYDVEEQYNAIIEQYFREELFKDPIMTRKVFQYYALFLNYVDSDKVYKTKSELYEDLKKEDFTTIKNTLASLSCENDVKVTLKKEKVKSIEELIIANYYFINGIDYTYETPYEYDVSSTEFRQYRPDFFLNKYHIYHEHYGIDRKGEALQFGEVESQKYADTMRWKRNTHAYYGTTCIETFSYEFKESTIFTNLERKLKGLGVEFNPLSNEQIRDTLNSVYRGHSFKSFIKVLSTFISLYKARYIDDTSFDILLEKSHNVGAYSKARSKMFLEIAKTIYNYYINTIRSNGRIDFDDMILKSTKVLNRIDNYKYKYIVVDEFQDISYSRMEFLKSLIKHGNSRLFAVGDDYQAIYRFAGCDLDIFLNFKNYFGEHSLSIIHSTHRNSQELQTIVTPFIQKNNEQLKKKIISNKHLTNPIEIDYYHINKSLAFKLILKTIFLRNPNSNILVLGRNNFDIDSILDDNIKYISSKKQIICDYYPELNIHYSTVHASKGLEEDNVILINCEEATTGFPNKVEDDPILALVLSSDSNFQFAEERRLFYVALTRTREYCYLLVNVDKPSVFIEEIKNKCFIANPQKEEDPNAIRYCPQCGGKLIKRKSKKGKDYYCCCHYPYCDYYNFDVKSVYYNKTCPKCGDYITIRRNRYGHPFYGCHNYPNCDFSVEIDEYDIYI